MNFDYCNRMSLEKWQTDELKKAYDIPDSVTNIGNRTFSGCSGLTSIEIPDSITTIGYNAFYGCAKLTSVKIPNRVWGFGDRAFKGCKGLADSDGFVIVNGNLYDYFGENKNVIIPDGVHCIRKEAFADCSFIVDITVPNSVKSISQNAFAGCDMIRKATLPAWKCGINFSNITNLFPSPEPDRTACFWAASAPRRPAWRPWPSCLSWEQPQPQGHQRRTWRRRATVRISSS
mgnify:CR=1 FL=1